MWVFTAEEVIPKINKCKIRMEMTSQILDLMEERRKTNIADKTSKSLDRKLK